MRRHNDSHEYQCLCKHDTQILVLLPQSTSAFAEGMTEANPERDCQAALLFILQRLLAYSQEKPEPQGCFMNP